MLNIALPAAIALGAAPIALALLKKLDASEKTMLLSDLNKAEKMLETLKDREAKLNATLRELDAEVSEIAGLYEITKAMSATLLFDEICRIFSDFLKKDFKFTSCRLLLMSRKDGIEKIEKEYKIEDGAVAEEALNFAEIPLMSRNEKIGVLKVAGLEESQEDRFYIAAKQFALEIQKVRLYEKVQELAVRDGLTEAFVRRYFLGLVKDELERSAKHKFKTSFLMIDLDYFKETNDTYGHLVGDYVLKAVAATLRRNAREIDLLGRYGGEEFSMLLPETDKEGALMAAERLRRAVSESSFRAYEEVVRITISVGVSTFPDDAKQDVDLIECADRSLYAAKAAGRNKVIGFNKEISRGGN